ncbi:MAG TPA: hypothetical protein VH186_09950 [Chloroflexia bacterium]|nr:hypothetical protein [Chloroflexia bacterium]
MQPSQPSLPERWLKMELFTDYHRIIGDIMTAELRTNGVLNSEAPQMLLERVNTTYLQRLQGETIASGYSRINKASVVIAIPNDEHETERLARASKIYIRGELLQHRVMIGLSNFEVSGNLHLNPDMELTGAFLQRTELFIGVTDATVIFLPNPSFRFTASSVLINRNRVDFICAGAP